MSGDLSCAASGCAATTVVACAYVHRVCLQVEEAHDTEVTLVVDRREVVRLTPPWIAARLSGEVVSPEEDARRRAEFRDSLLEAVRRGLEDEASVRVR